MLLQAERRRLLGAFVRSRREALPRPAGGRRRTPGLRREEVAERCGISTAWCSRVEQGRDLALSPGALGLTPAGRAYLFELALQRDPAPGAPGPDAVPPGLEAAVAAVGPPATCATGFGAPAPGTRRRRGCSRPGWAAPSLLAFVFRAPAAHRFIVDREERARRVIAEFRADTARAPDDPALLAPVAGLRADSPDFAALWDGHAVASRGGGVRRFRHPEDGILHYEQTTLVPTAHPDHKLVMLLPCPGPSPA